MSDIHIGAIPAEQLEKELNLFLDYIEDEVVDMVFINGDFFDKKLSVNSNHARLAINFMDNLLRLQDKYDYAIRIIRGTFSHDLNQLEIFRQFHNNPGIDFKIFNSVASETFIWNKKEWKFLYIPEEYVEDLDEYYGEYFKEGDFYHMIHGHGAFTHNSFSAMSSTSERHLKSAPHFDYDKLAKHTHAINFGHVHTGGRYKSKLIYNGSFSRFTFGEEEPKGFYHYVLDHDKLVSSKFIENKLARKFVTIDVDEIVSSNTSIEDKIKEIESITKNPDIFKTRIKYVNANSEEDLRTKVIKDYFNKNHSDDVVVKVTNLSKEEESENDVKMIDEYAFVFDHTIPTLDKIQQYVSKKHNVDISKESLEWALRNTHKTGKD